MELTVTKNDCNNVDRKHKSKAKESYFVINTERHGFRFIKRNYEFQSVRDLSRQSDHQVAPADGSDCKYQVYTVFHSKFNRKIDENARTRVNTVQQIGLGPEPLRSRVTDLGPGHFNLDTKEGMVRDSLFPIFPLSVNFRSVRT